jgi:hypothetical protein
VLPSGTPWLALAAVLSCKGCEGCWEPGLPDDPDERRGDTSGEDTADTSGEDTAPPPPCDVPETEPNDTLDEPDDVPQESLACGEFGFQGDADWLRIPEEDSAWLKFDVTAADVGSKANVTFSIWDEAFTLSATVYASQESTDPFLVFPTFGAGSYLVWLWEGDGGYGEDFGWAIRASETKAPVEWTTEEVEPDDLASEAMAIAEGDQVFAFFQENDDYDWYRVEIPETGPQWSFRIEANGSGSPVNINLFLYSDAILSDSGVSPLARDFKGDDEYDLDANLRYTFTTPGTYFLLVKEHMGRGGAFYWYTLNVTTTEGS